MGASALLGLIGIAAAGDAGLADALSRMVNASGPRAPDVAMVCGPSQRLLGRLADLSALAAVTGRPVPERLPDLLASPEQAAAHGLDPEGAVGFGLYLEEKQGWLRLPLVQGDRETAERLMDELGVEHVTDGEGWSVEGGKAQASIQNSELVVVKGQGTTGAIFDPTLLAGLPEEGGCLLWGANRPGLGVPVPGDEPLQTGMFFPFDGGRDVLVRLRLSDPAPAVLGHPASAPVGGTTSDAPTLVVAAGVSLQALLEDPAVARALELRQGDSRRVVRALDVGPGATVALFGALDPEALDWVAVLPVEGAAGPRKIARKGRHLLRRLDMRVHRGGPDALIAEGESSLVFGMADHGRLILGVNPARVLEVAARLGTSWLASADEERLGAWPVVAWTGEALSEGMGLPEGARLDVGLRAVDGLWEIGLRGTGLGDALRELMSEELRAGGQKLGPGVKDI